MLYIFSQLNAGVPLRREAVERREISGHLSRKRFAEHLREELPLITLDVAGNHLLNGDGVIVEVVYRTCVHYLG